MEAHQRENNNSKKYTTADQHALPTTSAGGKLPASAPVAFLHLSPPADCHSPAAWIWRERSLTYSCHSVLVPHWPHRGCRRSNISFYNGAFGVRPLSCLLSAPRSDLKLPTSHSFAGVSRPSVWDPESYSCSIKLTLWLPKHQHRAPSSHLKSSRTKKRYGTQVSKDTGGFTKHHMSEPGAYKIYIAESTTVSLHAPCVKIPVGRYYHLL